MALTITTLYLSLDCRLTDILSGEVDGLRKFSQETQNFVLGGVHLSGVGCLRTEALLAEINHFHVNSDDIFH